jgi:hypothetical protein
LVFSLSVNLGILSEREYQGSQRERIPRFTERGNTKVHREREYQGSQRQKNWFPVLLYLILLLFYWSYITAWDKLSIYGWTIGLLNIEGNIPPAQLQLKKNIWHVLWHVTMKIRF